MSKRFFYDKSLFKRSHRSITRYWDAFSSHPIPSLISFTGSTDVGRHIAKRQRAARSLRNWSLELGGNSPMVVLDDADIGQAVDTAVVRRLLHQGQICISTNRTFVDESVSDEFEDKFTDRASALKYGNPDDKDTVIGPVISSKTTRAHKGPHPARSL